MDFTDFKWHTRLKYYLNETVFLGFGVFFFFFFYIRSIKITLNQKNSNLFQTNYTKKPSK